MSRLSHAKPRSRSLRTPILLVQWCVTITQIPVGLKTASRPSWSKTLLKTISQLGFQVPQALTSSSTKDWNLNKSGCLTTSHSLSYRLDITSRACSYSRLPNSKLGSFCQIVTLLNGLTVWHPNVWSPWRVKCSRTRSTNRRPLQWR